MTDKKHTEYDRLPGTVETSGFRKASDEFTFTIATPKKYEEFVKAMLGRLSNFGIFFFVPCSVDQAEQLLSEKDSAPPVELGTPDPQIMDIGPVDAAMLAEWLTPEETPIMTERNVQVLEEKGVVIRISRGKYDLKRSVRRRIGDLTNKGEGKDSDMHQEKIGAWRYKRQMRELEYHERAGHLVNAEAMGRAIGKAKAAEKQQLLFMPKQLAPMLGADAAMNEAALEEWVYGFLKAQTEIDIDDLSAAAPDPDKIVKLGKRKKQKKKRKGAG